MSGWPARDRFAAIRAYLLVSAVLHAVWETVQLPLYTIWRSGTAREIAFAVAHCTVGDLMIAALSLIAAVLTVGHRAWPAQRYAAVAACAVALGICYTIYSEWSNLARNTWAYSELMPVIPVLGVGLSPLLQWLFVPPLALLWARKWVASHSL